MGLKILKKDTKKTNFMIGSFFLFLTAGFSVNMIYANIFQEEIVKTLHFLTIFLTCFAEIFILIFILLLLKTHSFFKNSQQIAIVGIFGLLLFASWFIPEGVTINETTDWKPVWSWPFLIYSYVICFSFAIIPALYGAVLVYKRLSDPLLRKKWRYFIVGIISNYYIYSGTALSNAINIPEFRLIWAMLSLPALFTGTLVYHGILRQD